MVKVLAILATVTFIDHFGYEYQRWKVCDLGVAFEQLLASRSATCEFVFIGGNLWHPLFKQEFALNLMTTNTRAPWLLCIEPCTQKYRPLITW